jgi:uncharacterized protein GlcG (DUF336 family)
MMRTPESDTGAGRRCCGSVLGFFKAASTSTSGGNEMFRKITLLVFSFCGGVAAHAAELPTRSYVPLVMANQAVMTAVAVCKKNGDLVTATFVDAGGLVRAVARDDLAGPHTIDSSRLKAYTALALGPTFGVSNTGEIAAKAATTPSGQALSVIPGFLLFAGGVLIKVHGQVVGGIGVGGAGNGPKDQVCAQAAVDELYENLR